MTNVEADVWCHHNFLLNHSFAHLFSLPPLNMSACPIDQAFFCDPDLTEEQVPTRHVLLNYANYEEDEDIRDEDVIRSKQGSLHTEEEIAAFKLKSKDRCPTCGNCNRCWSSGPVGEMCTFCTETLDHSIGRQVIFMINTAKRTPSIILDVQGISEAHGANHKIAKGKSTHRWMRTPVRTIEKEDILPRLKQELDRKIRELSAIRDLAAEHIRQNQQEEEGF